MVGAVLFVTGQGARKRAGTEGGDSPVGWAWVVGARRRCHTPAWMDPLALRGPAPGPPSSLQQPGVQIAVSSGTLRQQDPVLLGETALSRAGRRNRGMSRDFAERQGARRCSRSRDASEASVPRRPELGQVEQQRRQWVLGSNSVGSCCLCV